MSSSGSRERFRRSILAGPRFAEDIFGRSGELYMVSDEYKKDKLGQDRGVMPSVAVWTHTSLLIELDSQVWSLLWMYFALKTEAQMDDLQRTV